MSRIDNLCWWVYYTCENTNCLYSQEYRQNIWEHPSDPSYADCSSLAIGCARQAGYDTGSAWWTGDMIDCLADAGWTILGYNSDMVQKGDFVIRPATPWQGGHVFVYLGDGLIGEAYTDEIEASAQVRVTGYYEMNATHIIRPPADEETAVITTETGNVSENTMYVVEDQAQGRYWVVSGMGMLEITWDDWAILYKMGVRHTYLGSDEAFRLMEMVHELAADADNSATAYNGKHKA